MSDVDEPIGAIYDAVGDPERWRRLRERLAGLPHLSPEIEHHLALASRAHEQHLGLLNGIEILTAVHDRLVIGALVVDGTRQVRRANDTASKLLDGSTGLTLVSGCLRAADSDEDARLACAVARACQGTTRDTWSHSQSLVITRSGRPLLLLVVQAASPVRRFFEQDELVTVLMVEPGAVDIPPSDILRRLFGFTAREADFAGLLMQGMSVQEAARALGVTTTTARTFLARIAAKTDSPRQAQLVAHLLAIPHVTQTP